VWTRARRLEGRCPAIAASTLGCASLLRFISPRLAVGATVLGIALALAACGGSEQSESGGGSADEVRTAVEGLTGAERTAKLLELAAEEGELSVYTTSTLDYMSDVVEAFEDEYDLDVSIFKTSGGAIVQRMVEEAAAGYRGSDAVEANTLDMTLIGNEGLLEPYASPKADDLIDGSHGEGWTGDKFNTFVVAWNTDRVGRGDEPRSYDDLADPKWKGRLVLDSDDSEWYKTAWEHVVASGKTPQEADRLFEAIARNATFVNGHTLMTQLVAAGEFDVSLNSFLHTVGALTDDGAPLAWKPALEPLISLPDAVALVKDAKNPATAMLFVDFILDQGQEIFADFELTPARKDLNVPPSIDQIAVDVPDYVEHADEWVERYDRLQDLGTVRPDEN
jgi:iron(III) transport system substrate-binding protein